jgi:hypothetical protein
MDPARRLGRHAMQRSAGFRTAAAAHLHAALQRGADGDAQLQDVRHARLHQQVQRLAQQRQPARLAHQLLRAPVALHHHVEQRDERGGEARVVHAHLQRQARRGARGFVDL